MKIPNTVDELLTSKLKVPWSDERRAKYRATRSARKAEQERIKKQHKAEVARLKLLSLDQLFAEIQSRSVCFIAIVLEFRGIKEHPSFYFSGGKISITKSICEIYAQIKAEQQGRSYRDIDRDGYKSTGPVGRLLHDGDLYYDWQPTRCSCTLQLRELETRGVANAALVLLPPSEAHSGHDCTTIESIFAGKQVRSWGEGLAFGVMNEYHRRFDEPEDGADWWKRS